MAERRRRGKGNLPQHLFTLVTPSLGHLHDVARTSLLEGIKADNMAPYYRVLTSSSEIGVDPELLESMEKENEDNSGSWTNAWLKPRRQGESEISDALKARANHLTRIGDEEFVYAAVAAQRLALEKTPGLGSRIDITLTLLRIGFFFGDNTLITDNLARAEKLIEEGGNRLKVYRGLHAVSIRQFKSGGELLLDALSIFTATEPISYNDFVALTVIASILTLARVDLKKKLITSPEVFSVLPDLPVPEDLLRSLYDCHYANFFVALATLEQTYLLPSRLLFAHTRYYVREMRILAYPQLLESYRSVTLESLGGAFGVSVDLSTGEELSQFIANGRWHCTIDKYDKVVKQWDVLLNPVQRLSKVLYWSLAGIPLVWM
ncbi:26S proteasome subunit RPN7-domain-containing protein [Pisolithus marmoratus]|nr:26S proteasome subunit RPN7-domain-containing protein [Pisolithus marmoratus]